MCWLFSCKTGQNKQAAKTFFRKLLKGLTSVPWVIIPDKLKSYSAAKQGIVPGVEHWQHRYGSCPALPLSLGSHGSALPAETSPSPCRQIPSRDAAKMPHLAGPHEPPNWGLTVITEDDMYFSAR
jgi:hypothetical protein